MKISNKRASILNSLSSILYQVIIASFSIVNRSFFLQYFGVELLGLSSTFSAIITITSLAETGLGSCVIYRLYKALQKEDNEEINDLVNIARAYLSTIGIIIIIIAFLFIPLLRFVITGITLDFNIYVYFILQVFSTAAFRILDLIRDFFLLLIKGTLLEKLRMQVVMLYFRF